MSGHSRALDIQIQMRTVSEESQIAQDYTEDNYEFLERSEWSEMREKLKVQGVTKSRTRPSHFHFHTCIVETYFQHVYMILF